MNGYKQDAEIVGLYVPTTDLEVDFEWGEKELQLFARASNSQTFINNLIKINELESKKENSRKVIFTPLLSLFSVLFAKLFKFL